MRKFPLHIISLLVSFSNNSPMVNLPKFVHSFWIKQRFYPAFTVISGTQRKRQQWKLLSFPVYLGINDRSRLCAYFVALIRTALLCAEFALEFDAQTALTL